MALPNNSKRKIFDGRYEILSIVGRGADSVVYHARHITGAAQEVAIKVLVNRGGTSTLTDKLRREALTLVSCRHKYVVRLDDFHSVQELCYLSMEYAPFGDLAKFIATLPNNRLSAEQVRIFLKQSLEALDFVHATGVVHRDLKPENILVLRSDEIRLADFGLALLPGDEVQLEELQKAVGSFDYLAPEVLDGIRYDTLSDLYSLGVCFYEAATGEHPFAHATIAERKEARRDHTIRPLSEIVPDLPSHVAAVITTLMKFSATERFQSASEALQALTNPEYRAAPSVTPTVSSSVEPSFVVSNGASGETLSDEVKPEPTASLMEAVQGEGKASTPSQDAANSDVIQGRESTPTEKIDLERIKAIIARDTQRKTNTQTTTPTSDFTSVDSIPSSATAADALQEQEEAPASLQAVVPVSRSKVRNAQSEQPGTRPQLSRIASNFGRYVSVAVLFAILTVGTLYAYQSFFGPAKTDVSNKSTSDEATRSRDSDSDKVESAEQRKIISLLALPAGVHAGTLTGLFPGSNIAMAFIAQPEKKQLTLVLALEGWIPVTVNINSEPGRTTEGPTFRAHGFILKFTQESSSDAIAGTVLDVVTGETGTWHLIN